jgi:hypothetical protein
MKQFISKAQNLGRRAAGLSQAVQALPMHAAKIREAVTMTGGELHQIRADVQSNIHALRADSEDHLLRTMREVSDHATVFEQAGYELIGMDLDMALNQRLAVHLDRFEIVSHAELRTLVERQSCATVRSILAGILKAEETAANVELSHLQFVGLVVHAGLAPTIRMEWRVIDAAPEPAIAIREAATPAHPATNFPPMASMFESRPLPASTAAAAPPLSLPSVAADAAAALASARAAESKENSWGQSALERFKKMPGGSKYR